MTLISRFFACDRVNICCCRFQARIVLTSEASDLLVTKTPNAPRVNNVEEKHRTWSQEEEEEKEEYRD